MTEELKRDISQEGGQMVDNSVPNVQPLDNVEVSTSNSVESVTTQNPFMYNADASNTSAVEVPTVTEQTVIEPVNQDVTFTPADNTNISEPIDASTTFAFTEQSTPVAVETPVVNNNPFMYAVESTQPVTSPENTFAYNTEPVQPQPVESSFAYTTPSDVQQPVVDNNTSFAYVDQSVPTVPMEPVDAFTYNVEQPVQNVTSVENNTGYAYVEPAPQPVDPATQVPTGTYDPQVNFTQENREEKSSIGFMVFFGILMLIVVLVLPYFIGYN